MLATPAGLSNVLRASLTRTEGLPYGDRATIVSFEVRRVTQFSASYEFIVYSPRVVGRTLSLIRTSYFPSGEIRLTVTNVISESPANITEGSFGGFQVPVGGALEVTLEERAPSGALLVSETRRIIVP